MLKIGLILTAATVTIVVLEFFRTRRRALPAYGWLGLVALLGAQWLMFRGVEPAATYFNPLAWTAYLLLADAATFAISGNSLLRDEPRGILKMAGLSALLWLPFEALNLRLTTWSYIGLRTEWLERWFGYAWAFATITPAIFMTAALVESFGWFTPDSPAVRGKPRVRVRVSRGVETTMMAAGAALLVIPPLLPRQNAKYLFGLIWLGVALLLDPINHRLNLPSWLGDLERGYRGRMYSFLLAGWVCGWLWEFWNFWAAAKWTYNFPGLARWKIFAMPAPGYLVYPVFALECFALYVTGAWILSRKYADE
jgi:hypothetical protein